MYGFRSKNFNGHVNKKIENHQREILQSLLNTVVTNSKCRGSTKAPMPSYNLHRDDNYTVFMFATVKKYLTEWRDFFDLDFGKKAKRKLITGIIENQ